MTTAHPVPATTAHGQACSGPTRTATVPVRLDAAVVADLRQLATTATGTGVDAALGAGLQILLAQLSGRREVTVGVRLPGTTHGFGVRADLTAGQGLRAAIDTFAVTVAEAARHAEDLSGITDELRAATAQEPFVDAVLELHTDAPDAVELAVHEALVAARPPISLSLRDGPATITGEMRYRIDHFDAAGAARFAEMYSHLLGALAAEPDEDALAISPVPPAERERILLRLNPYRRPHITHTTMAQPFEEQARRTPDAVALVGDQGLMTYAELNGRANRLAWELRANGARPGAFVAVSMPRSLDLMVALYAVAKSGAAYVPIDSDLPDARMSFMLEDSAPVMVLTDEQTRTRIPSGSWRVLAVDTDFARWAAQPDVDLPPEDGNHLIHMLYTSGTTGKPKAVAYPVDGALADIEWLHRSYPYGPGDTALFKTSCGFDVSIWEIFWPLYHGARIAICPPESHRDPAALRDVIDRYQVTAMFMVPSMMPSFFAHTQEGSCPSLRWLFCGGDAVTPLVRDGFHERFSGSIINCYGPTELGCVAETVLSVEPGAPVPIGPPVEHRRVYVLDDRLQPLPIGAVGELYVGGDVGIAQSYHRHAGLTAERFSADPFGRAGGRMYRTGDLVRYRPDGVLEHMGRVGRQVKVRGVRIELAEIEAVIAEVPDITQCVATVVPDSEGEIAAFAVAVPGAAMSAPTLFGHARRVLPAHMVPSTITVLEAIPTFVNGKIDQGRLLTLIDRAGIVEPAPYEQPETVTEARIAAFFAQVLQMDRVSVTTKFFDLGGHSLQVFSLIELCTEEFGVDLAVRQVLRDLTPRALARLIDAELEAAR